MPASHDHQHTDSPPDERTIETELSSVDPDPSVPLPQATTPAAPPAELAGPTRRERRMAGRNNARSDGKISGRGFSTQPAPRKYTNRRRAH